MKGCLNKVWLHHYNDPMAFFHILKRNQALIVQVISIFANQISIYSLQVQNLRRWLSQTSISSSPHRTLRSFNYLMQDVGIIQGRHLKEAPAFIYWDGSCVRREERGLLEYHEAWWCSLQRHTCLCLFLPLSLTCVSFFLAVSVQLTFFVEAWSSPRRPEVTDRVGRSTRGKATTVISHFSTCCPQVYAPGTSWIALPACLNMTLNMD